MVALNEYAALSAQVYNNERGNRGPKNKLELPASWLQLSPASGFPAQTSYNQNFFSFTAGAYVNSITKEIVIAYKGTDFLLEFSGRIWTTIGDVITDVAAVVNSEVSAVQLVQAATYYADVKKWAIANGYNPNNKSINDEIYHWQLAA